MAASVVANEFVGHGNSDESNPRPSKYERVGHPQRQCPEEQNQFLSKDVQEWYHSTVRPCQQEREKRCATRLFELADTCMTLWDSFLKDNGLLPDSVGKSTS
jgi:hypothetical protein